MFLFGICWDSCICGLTIIQLGRFSAILSPNSLCSCWVQLYVYYIIWSFSQLPNTLFIFKVFPFISVFHFVSYQLPCSKVLGASIGDPPQDKVVRRRPDKQGRSGLQGFRKAAPVLTLKMISVFLMLAILDYSLISVTQIEGLPQSLSK